MRRNEFLNVICLSTSEIVVLHAQDCPASLTGEIILGRDRTCRVYAEGFVELQQPILTVVEFLLVHLIMRETHEVSELLGIGIILDLEAGKKVRVAILVKVIPYVHDSDLHFIVSLGSSRLDYIIKTNVQNVSHGKYSFL